MTNETDNPLSLRGGPLQLLFERSDLPRFELPPALEHIYAGDFGLPRPVVFANFVESIDGTVALPEKKESGHIISGSNRADRFVMGVLRACADAVLIGAGTFRTAQDHLWHAERIFPPAARSFAEHRKSRGLKPKPKLVLLTESGNVDPNAPALSDALVLTTPRGALALGSRVPPGCRIVVLGSGPLELNRVFDLLRSEGFEYLLTEGGPTLMGELVSGGLVDELFITISPRLFGQARDDGRKNLVYGIDLQGVPLELLSARRHASHLFLRYAFVRSPTAI